MTKIDWDVLVGYLEYCISICENENTNEKDRKVIKALQRGKELDDKFNFLQHLWDDPEPAEQLVDGDSVKVLKSGFAKGQKGAVINAKPNKNGKICVAFSSPWIGWFKPDELKRVKEK